MLALALVGLLAGSPSVGAHSQLERSAPPAGSIQGDAPRTVDLWFSEDLDTHRSSVEVFAEDRQRVDAGEAIVDPADPIHLTVPLADLTDGTYTVAWHVASSSDGHLVSGSFTFRVGTARMPGAATTQSETPSALAVVLRWGTLLGLALAAGWFLIGAPTTAVDRRRSRVALAAALLAFGATAAIVPAQAFWLDPTRPGLATALSAMPVAWTVRLALCLLLAAVVLASLRWPERRALRLGGGLVAGFALFTLVFTSHAAARPDGRGIAIAIGTVHLEAIAFWIGGLAHVALAFLLGEADARTAARRFSRIALGLAPVAIVSGVLAAGFELRTLDNLWRSDYGRLLAIKGLAAVVILGLAWWNRRAIAGGLASAVRGARLRRPLSTEAAIGGATLLVAALLAFTATPSPAHQEPIHMRASTDDGRFAHLMLDPASTGQVRVSSWLSDADNQPLSELQSVVVSASALESTLDLPSQRLAPSDGGRWSAKRFPLTVRGWWSLRTTFVLPGGRSTQSTFYLLLPDPTFARARARAARDHSSQPAAAEVFRVAQDNLFALQTLRTEEVLGDGLGNSVHTRYRYQAPDRLTYSTSSGNDSVAIGLDQYYREHGGPWVRRTRVDPVEFPDAYRRFYTGATDFQLGRQQEIDGELCQVITFYVPPHAGYDEAWYSWWVGAESHQVRREAMVAEYHFMTNHFLAYDEPVEIVAPDVAGP
jgi:copper transport protein